MEIGSVERQVDTVFGSGKRLVNTVSDVEMCLALWKGWWTRCLALRGKLADTVALDERQ